MTGGSTTGSANAGTFAFAQGGAGATLVPGSNAFTQSFANFINGSPATFTQASIDPITVYLTDIYEGYAEDDFHVTPKLAMNIGMRYTYFAGATSASLEGQSVPLPLLNFAPATYSAAAAPTLTTAGLICTPLRPAVHVRQMVSPSARRSIRTSRITTSPCISSAVTA